MTKINNFNLWKRRPGGLLSAVWGMGGGAVAYCQDEEARVIGPGLSVALRVTFIIINLFFKNYYNKFSIVCLNTRLLYQVYMLQP